MGSKDPVLTDAVGGFWKTTWRIIFEDLDTWLVTLTWPSWLNGKPTFWDDEYLVGKISRSNFFFSGPGRLSEVVSNHHLLAP